MSGKVSELEKAKLNTLAKYLRRTGGNVAEACELMGISRRTAYRWINKHRELRNFLGRLRNE